MNKSGPTDARAKETELSKTKATQIVDLFFDEVTDPLSNSEWVEIRPLFSMFIKKSEFNCFFSYSWRHFYLKS